MEVASLLHHLQQAINQTALKVALKKGVANGKLAQVAMLATPCIMSTDQISDARRVRGLAGSLSWQSKNSYMLGPELKKERRQLKKRQLVQSEPEQKTPATHRKGSKIKASHTN